MVGGIWEGHAKKQWLKRGGEAAQKENQRKKGVEQNSEIKIVEK